MIVELLHFLKGGFIMVNINGIPDSLVSELAFSKEELEALKNSITKAKEGIDCYFKEGIAVAQNKYN